MQPTPGKNCVAHLPRPHVELNMCKQNFTSLHFEVVKEFGWATKKEFEWTTNSIKKRVKYPKKIL